MQVPVDNMDVWNWNTSDPKSQQFIRSLENKEKSVAEMLQGLPLCFGKLTLEGVGRHRQIM